MLLGQVTDLVRDAFTAQEKAGVRADARARLRGEAENSKRFGALFGDAGEHLQLQLVLSWMAQLDEDRRTMLHDENEGTVICPGKKLGFQASGD
jgi:hypothetical protein